MAPYGLRRPSGDDVNALKEIPAQRIRERYPGSERYARRVSEMMRDAAMTARESDEYHHLGDVMLDSMARYFPEEYQARRRSLMIKSFAAGAAAGGVAVGYLTRRLWSN
ncbi:hypothetical protein SAMN04487948_103116 [Halogranum amylolyticum]|uniref:Uncharacterized protein n=1 Tax=Halogranum amylolyticum TaxID=660520 RepID=A0A1H8QHI3_9EURY|nr:hypothetical protein [Halogranum amylolyticum]SEO53377.1 hypothetical protein SAMN04487948_103116 [Halogranum amylolyticum]